MTHKPVPQYQGLTEPHKPFIVVMIINNNNISQLQLKINPLAKITNYWFYGLTPTVCILYMIQPTDSPIYKM